MIRLSDLTESEINALVAQKIFRHEHCPIHYSFFCCGRQFPNVLSWEGIGMIVEKMIIDGCEFSISTHSYKKDFRVEFENPEVEAIADTPWLAVIMAALRANGVECE